ncbi:hypothetical protein E2C01_086597 [Portunus trituberculatus]|uniref:Uncharacterized protein n=1 Tax=Portunus trituberculatus TaxID=210409 RepID=A0A5B7J5U4_PORTR|nr:hypothetical protein [Portunus trituberculatus]
MTSPSSGGIDTPPGEPTAPHRFPSLLPLPLTPTAPLTHPAPSPSALLPIPPAPQCSLGPFPVAGQISGAACRSAGAVACLRSDVTLHGGNIDVSLTSLMTSRAARTLVSTKE